MPIASAGSACAALNARLPLPINRDQTHLYRAAFDKLGANGTVALRSESEFFDSESGRTLAYDGDLEEFDKRRHLGMRLNENQMIKWRSYKKTKRVYAVCEKVLCDSVSSKSTGNRSSENT